jgi:hypothetical protein
VIRTATPLLALLLLAAVPARAQESAHLAASAAPLPALLQPSAAPARAVSDPVVHMVRGAGIGAAVGCLVVGVVAASVDVDPEPNAPHVNAGLFGCFIGGIAGGVAGFTLTGARLLLVGH